MGAFRQSNILLGPSETGGGGTPDSLILAGGKSFISVLNSRAGVLVLIILSHPRLSYDTAGETSQASFEQLKDVQSADLKRALHQHSHERCLMCM